MGCTVCCLESGVGLQLKDRKAPVCVLHMPSAFCSDPSAVQELIAHGVTTVILRTDESQIDWGAVKHDVERIQGSGDSYSELIRRNPSVTFWLEIGNEPDNASYAGVGSVWGYRWTALDTYKNLALNREDQSGHLLAL